MPTWIEDFFTHSTEKANLPVARRTRYSLHLRGAGRLRLAFITGVPMHFYDQAKRSWEPIDTTLRLMGDGRLGAAGLPFSLALDGDVKVDGQAHRHRAWRVGLLANGRFEQLARFGEGQVAGDRLVREAGPFKHETILLPSGLKEQLTLHENPAPNAKAASLFAIETLLPAAGFPDGWVDEHTREAVRFPRGWAQDAAGVRIPLMRWVETRGSLQQLYSGVPAEWLQTAAYPLVLDPDIDITGGTGDATIEGSNVSTSTLLDASSGTLAVGGRTSAGLAHLWRVYLKFNTSSLAPNAEVQQANLRLYPTAINTYVSWTVYVRQYSWAAADPLTDANRESAWDGLYAAANTAIMATSANPVGTPVVSQALPTSWIQIEGSTYYGLWNNQESYAYPANQGGQHQYASGNSSTPSQRPVLMLEYIAGYPRSGPLPVRGVIAQPRATLSDTRRKLRARSRRVALHTPLSFRTGQP